MVILIFVSLVGSTFLCILFFTGSTPESTNLQKRMHAIQLEEGAARRTVTRASVVATIATQQGGRLQGFADKLEVTKKLERLVLQSGSTASMSQIVRWSASAAIVSGIVAFLVFHWIVAGCAGFLAAAFAPFIVLRWMRTKRIQRFEAALPDAIELMSRSLRAGHALSSAIEIIADQSVEPLAGEFSLVAQQQQLGAMFRDTLLELAERVPSQDLHFLVTAMLVQRENGGDLTQILDRTAKVISERLRIAGEVRTYSAQGRLTGWLLSALPVVMLVIINIANPGYSDILFSEPLGRMMLGGAAVSIAAGIFTIRKIVDIKV